ncbi:MAG: hypothetical protein OEZ59_12450, partial [Deltaproteobacteria bacterium]|nr:hypothetical protein [Deltaproteobacteria bacterium]
MKAMFFARPLEYRVEIPAERLEQGLVLAGRLDVSNRGPAELQGLTFAVGLAHADFKALKKDGSQAF